MCQLIVDEKLMVLLDFANFVKIVEIWWILGKLVNFDENVILRILGLLMNPNRKCQN